MKNNITKKAINEYNEITKKPNDDIWAKIENRINAEEQNKIYKKSSKLRNVLVAVLVITIAFALSAFVEIPIFSRIWNMSIWDIESFEFGTILETIIIDGFEVTKVDKMKSAIESNPGYVSLYRHADPEVFASNNALESSKNIEQLKFDTIEEANKYLPFAAKSLKYIPDGYWFEYAKIAKDERDNYANHCQIRYDNRLDEDDSWIYLYQSYNGKNNTPIQINTTGDIEKIILNNDIEAILIKIVWTDRNNMIQYEINWIENYILYVLTGILDRDEMIKMAESME